MAVEQELPLPEWYERCPVCEAPLDGIEPDRETKITFCYSGCYVHRRHVFSRWISHRLIIGEERWYWEEGDDDPPPTLEEVSEEINNLRAEIEALPNEQRGFLQALRENRYDKTLRLIYADWLEEHGYDDEAVYQRAWTEEKQRAMDGMMAFAVTHRLTYDEAMQIGHTALKDGGVGFGADDPCDAMRNRRIRNNYWDLWEKIEGRSIDEGTRDSHSYSCAC